MNILRYADTARKCGVAPMTIKRWATRPEYADMAFPKPFELGTNSVGFVEEEVDAWLAARAAERDAPDETQAA